MATLRNKIKLATLNKEKYYEHPWSNLAQNSKVPSSQKDNITQISQESEGKETKTFFQEFSGTRNCVLGALSHLDFLMNVLIQGLSATTPETSRNTCGTNQGKNEDDSKCGTNP